MNCTKAEKQCSGYAPEIQWIDETGPYSSSNPASRSASYASGVPFPLLYQIMSPSAQQSQLFAQVIAASRSEQHQSTQVSGNHAWSDWFHDLAKSKHSSHASDAAIRAMSLSHLARTGDNARLLIRSREEYSKALTRLNAMLQTPSKACSLDALITTVMMSFFEIQNCTTGKKSWNQHAAAVARLLQLRGAAAHREGLARSTLLAFRSFLILHSMQTRQPCFLNTPAWQEVMDGATEHIDADSIPSALALFLRELARHPVFYVVMKENASTTDPSACLRILAKGQELRHAFKTAHACITRALCLNGIGPITVDSEQKDSLFPTVIRYPNSYIGSFYCGYWTELTSLNYMLTILGNRLRHTVTPDIDDIDLSTLLESYHTESIENSRSVCSSVEDLCRGTFLSPMQLVPALRTAMRFLTSDAEIAWIRNEMRHISEALDWAKFAHPNSILEPDEGGI